MEKQEEEKQQVERLSRRIKQLRLAKGYTNYEHFAYELGMSRSQYGKYEAGHNITYLSLLRVVKGLNITLSEFFAEGFDNLK